MQFVICAHRDRKNSLNDKNLRQHIIGIVIVYVNRILVFAPYIWASFWDITKKIQ